jgi:excinuclease UvrABC ATPase subunit
METGFYIVCLRCRGDGYVGEIEVVTGKVHVACDVCNSRGVIFVSEKIAINEKDLQKYPLRKVAKVK